MIVDQPMGGVGASLMIQLGIAAFYDVDRARVGERYPEIHIVHVGDFQGSFGWYDIFPPRKEVLVADQPAAVVAAINDVGITRLVVADKPVRPAVFVARDTGAARDRLRGAFACSPYGTLDDADVVVAACNDIPESNTRIVLHPERTGLEEQLLIDSLARVAPQSADEVLLASRTSLPPEELRDAISSDRQRSVLRGGLPVETYRRLDVDEALGMLHSVGTRDRGPVNG